MRGQENVSQPAGGRPMNLGDALRQFHGVMGEASVPQKRRAYYVRWVERFNAFRLGVLRRSFQTCAEGDLVAFLQRQRDRSGLARW